MNRILMACLLAAAVAVSGSPPAAAARTPGGSIAWQPCAGQPEAECGVVEVPLNWDAPSGPKITLSVVRRKATDPAARVGTLFYNPGGPGGQTAMIVRDYPSFAFSNELRRRFDVVGVDPRGVGGSGAVRCGLPVHDPGVRQFPRTPAEYRTMVAHNAALGRSCLDATGPLLRHIDTVSVARDLDAVRAALGEEKVSYLGKSYGTMLGAEYARLFPGRVRTMALDGAVDRALSPDRLVTDATVAVEDSFEQFAAWCDRTDQCPLRGRDVGQVWDALVGRAERDPIPINGSRPLTAEELRYVAYVFLTQLPEYGVGLATAIVQAEQGDAALFGTMRGQALDDPASTAAYRSILCLDIAPGLDDFGDLRRRHQQVRALAPHLRGTSEFWDMTTGCVGWPIPAANTPRPGKIHGVPPVLVVGNTHDAATPLRWARSLSARIEGSGLLVNDGLGHTAYLRSTCATEQMDRYLATGRLPAAETTCRAADAPSTGRPGGSAPNTQVPTAR
ncbi:alpha/beta fold hydrolase [Nonomuraea sp. NPDC046802]|uniref:alpha/beta hydrolase n=1 Tax=Nonomuraea sp. NPDC046802 TaxID=3154919 RepID=UPI0033E4700C